MKNSLLWIILFLTYSLYAQTTGTQVVKTDSSTIKISTLPGAYKQIEETLNGSRITHSLFYYPDTITVHFDQYFDYSYSPLKEVGISKSYYANGELKMTVDKDNGEWMPVKVLLYPSYIVLNNIKSKGDSIIKSIYGNNFFKKHIRFNLNASYYFDKKNVTPDYRIKWLSEDSTHKFSAAEFDLRYDLSIENNFFAVAIQLVLDEYGNVVPSERWSQNWTVSHRQPEAFKNTGDNDFELTKKEALQLALQHGLNKTDSSKILCLYEWEDRKEKRATGFMHNIRIYVYQEGESTVRTYYEKPYKPIRLKRREVKTRFKVWVFNPWTREFLGIKNMHRINTYGGGIAFWGNIVDD